MDCVIETFSLTKEYGAKKAVNEMNVRVGKGDIYGLIGKNGAGKTTLLKLLLGLVTPSSGEMRLFGSDDPDKERPRIGSLIEAPALFKNETAYENMKRFCILCGKPFSRIDELLKLVGLEGIGKKKVGAFSLGMKQRLGIAVALIGEPEVLILDEPINGLDPAGIKDIRDTITELHKKGVTFVISSHLLDELGKIATKYGIISDGVLVEEISAEDLRAKCRVSLTFRTDDGEKTEELLKGRFPELALRHTGDETYIESEVKDPSVLNEFLVGKGVRVYEMTASGGDFEQFFIDRLGV